MVFGLVGDWREGAVAISVRVTIPIDLSGLPSREVGTGSLVVMNLASEDFAKYHPELSVELLTKSQAFRLEAAGGCAVVTT